MGSSVISMSKLTKLVKAEIYRIVVYQLIIIVGFVLVALFLTGIHSGLSVAVGAICYWLPTLVFMLRVSSYTGARAAMRFMVALFAGEVVKLVLCSVLFLIAIKYLHLQFSYALIGLIGAIIAFWIASIGMLFQTRVRI